MVLRCVEILSGRESDEETLLVLAGPGATEVLRGKLGGGSGYWPRVWALRGLLYAWDESVTPAVIESAKDEAWRVREMCAKVVARHHVGDAIGVMAALTNDPVLRVREAADRALVRIVQSGD